ncbi:MAG: hypothetical protein F4123_09870 [Gemmatimonadetes bacterium]|nr:hypothetical protein [Gemmatimonadota bacterium]MYB99219.1 hypothetical protein [Gemmatimonadota bacterium]MYI46664.1 hypothetical protein [Gemmatimonadota bacterium]
MFAAASRAMGDSRSLSREFARAGRPRWKWLLVAGWVLFAASFMMPTFKRPFLLRLPPPFPGTDSSNPGTGSEYLPGWEVFVEALSGQVGPLGTVSALSNLLIPVTAFAVLGRWTMKARWPVRLMAGATGMNICVWMSFFLADLHVGYYLWVASFACVTVAWWLCNRGWSSANAVKVAASVSCHTSHVG